MKLTIRTLSIYRIFSALLILSSVLIASSASVFAVEKSKTDASTEKKEAAVKEADKSIAAIDASKSTPEESPATANESGETKEEEAPAPSAIKPPQVAIRMLGNEYDIQVLYDHAMDPANNDMIESIQMETPKGDFLGLTQFGPNAKEAYGEFMVNQKLAEFKEVVLVATSPKDGVSRTTIKLEPTEKSEIDRAGITPNAKRPVASGKSDAAGAKKGKKFKIF